MRDTSFIFVCCQAGAEPALKKEITRAHPSLRFAYSRLGFVTFKQDDGALDPGFELHAVFARSYGLSLGKTTTGPAPVLELARELRSQDGRRPRLHVWERDRHVPGEEPKDFEAGQWARTALNAISSSAGRDDFDPVSTPDEGDLVLDVVAVEENEWWFGFHRHAPSKHAPWPGGKPRIEMPAESPSRAYIKLEEAILWSRAALKSGDIAVEIGSAPGGASLALLDRGLKVIGIDPGEMDPRVLTRPSFAHIRRPVARVLREELPASIQWLLLDMNVEPRISLFAVDRLATRMADSLLGVFLTVKLNQWNIADEIPSMLDHVRAMGMVRTRATQLPSNRQEIMIHGLSRKGLMRRSESDA
jgi:23S rRNA (cytidine2498-2'-O)-methyltransferase